MIPHKSFINISTPTDLTENPYQEKHFFCFGVSQRSVSMVQRGIAVELVPWRPILKFFSHLLGEPRFTSRSFYKVEVMILGGGNFNPSLCNLNYWELLSVVWKYSGILRASGGKHIKVGFFYVIFI
jgi:hypothetical protein